MNGASNTEIRLLTVQSKGNGNISRAIYNWEVSSLRIAHVTVISSAAGWSGGIESRYSSVTMNNVTVYASGGGTTVAFANYDGSSAILRNCSIIATGPSGTGVAHGVHNVADLIMIDVTVIAQNGQPTWNWSLKNDYGRVLADRCSFEGDQIVNTPFGGGTVKIGASKLVGAVSGGGPFTCVSSYDGSYAPLDPACQ